MRKVINGASRAGVALSVWALSATAAHAVTPGDDAMPWEGGLSAISSSLSGPVAYFIAVIGFVVAGIGFVIQGEMTGIMKKLVQAVMGIAVLLGVVSLLNTFFGATAAIF